MKPIDGQPILTAAEMRAAEEAAAPTPDAMYGLMERAGAGVADAVRRLAAGAEVLVLCGPGNNGGDGYVAARILRERGVPVRVSALTPPRTALARRAAATWDGPTAHYTTGDQTRTDQPAWGKRKPEPAPVLVDALFGTGGREGYESEPWVREHRAFFGQAGRTIAVDLPLGVSATGAHLFPTNFVRADLTLALGALKPAHVRPDSAPICGEVRVVDLGLDLADVATRVIGRPTPPAPGVDTHKFSRGMVGVISGAMPGAARLAATAAARAGAGYVALFGGFADGPAALVRRPLTEEALSDGRLDVVVVGPGLGRDERGRRWLDWLVDREDLRLVIDGDALRMLDPDRLFRRRGQMVLTPHEGEYQHLMGRLARVPDGRADPFKGEIEAVKALAPFSAAVMVRKGSLTRIADFKRCHVAPGGSPWLSTAGSGDVLAGAIAAMVASYRHAGRNAFAAAAAGVWLHAEAARLCGASFIADDLAHALTAARASL